MSSACTSERPRPSNRRLAPANGSPALDSRAPHIYLPDLLPPYNMPGAGPGSRGRAVGELVGRTLGPDGQYLLLELIGRGGMAAVYAATQVALQRRVAIK